HLAQVAESLHDDPVVHPRSEAVDHETDDRDIRQIGKCQDVVDAGAARKQDLELRRALEEIRLRLPDDGIARLGKILLAVGGPQDLPARERTLQGCIQLAALELQIDDYGIFGRHFVTSSYWLMAAVSTASRSKAAAINARV